MKYLSVCSGIEAASVAFKPLGWKAVAFSEVDKAACRLLSHHYPDVPNWGDMTKFKEWPDADVDVLIGGTPCQSFSVAGLRKGMDDPRGNLALTFLAIADRYKPSWIIWENVPGVLSSNGGRDFGAILGGMVELGYGFAYRVLDAQFFNLAQRRERVFVVGYLGDWRPPAAVLFERESLFWDPAPRREARKDVARPLAAGSPGGSGYRNDADTADNLIVMSSGQANAEIREDGGATTLTCLHEAPTLRARDGARGVDSDGTDTLIVAHAFKASHYTRGKDGAPSDIVPPLSADADKGDQDTLVLAFSGNDHGADEMADLSPTLRAGGHHKSHANGGVAPAIASTSVVRRLTPTECERLQGFPDGYTQVPVGNKPTADGPRYKQLGNSFAVPVVRWIGERIQMVENIRGAK